VAWKLQVRNFAAHDALYELYLVTERNVLPRADRVRYGNHRLDGGF
jgi:hypothetical protein